MNRPAASGRVRRFAVVLGLAAGLDVGVWCGFWLFFTTVWPAPAFDERLESLPIVELSLSDDPALPVVDVTTPAEERP